MSGGEGHKISKQQSEKVGLILYNVRSSNLSDAESFSQSSSIWKSIERQLG